MTSASHEIISLVRNAGVVGAGGAGMPTYLKLQDPAHTVIVNGTECEPLLYSDKSVLENNIEGVIEGLKAAMKATGATKGIITISEAFPELIESVKKQTSSPISVQPIGDYYPSGDEFLLVYEVTQKIIPEGGTPADVGVLVLNATTVFQIDLAIQGVPVTQKAVTIAGAVKQPQIVTVPIGTSYFELVKLAGGATSSDYTILDGGPMMGTQVLNPNDGIAKNTTGIVVLPSHHRAIRNKSTPFSQLGKNLEAAACDCSRNDDFCPRHLIGHTISPGKTIRATRYGITESLDSITSAFLCSGCGLCEVMGCESIDLSPRLVFQDYQRRLTDGGITNPHRKVPQSVNSQFENRKVSSRVLLKRLQLEAYSNKPKSGGLKVVSQVQIPIQRHQGSPSVTQVQVGQAVRRGDVIASSPRDQNGSTYHASIHGKVTNITDRFITIREQFL